MHLINYRVDDVDNAVDGAPRRPFAGRDGLPFLLLLAGIMLMLVVLAGLVVWHHGRTERQLAMMHTRLLAMQEEHDQIIERGHRLADQVDWTRRQLCGAMYTGSCGEGK